MPIDTSVLNIHDSTPLYVVKVIQTWGLDLAGRSHPLADTWKPYWKDRHLMELHLWLQVSDSTPGPFDFYEYKYGCILLFTEAQVWKQYNIKYLKKKTYELNTYTHI